MSPTFIAIVATGSFVAYIVYAYRLRARSRAARGPSIAERGGLARWLPAFVWVPYLVMWLRPGPEMTITEPLRWLGSGLTVAGIAVAVWAASTLGRHFDVEVQVHRGHEVIRSGPYALVRHPIYTGLGLHYLGACLATGNVLLIAGTLALTFPGLYVRARAEEELLRSELGAAYDHYTREVPMLLPFGGGRRSA